MIELYRLYVHRTRVLIPLTAKTTDGIFVEQEPVQVIDTSDSKLVMEKLLKLIKHGNPVVRPLTMEEMKIPVVPRHAGVKTWAAFEKSAISWSIVINGPKYQLCPQRRLRRGWEDDPDKIEIFSGEEALSKLLSSLAEQVELSGNV